MTETQTPEVDLGGTCDCGEREFGEFGWFSTEDEDGEYRTICQACGTEVEA